MNMRALTAVAFLGVEVLGSCPVEVSNWSGEAIRVQAGSWAGVVPSGAVWRGEVGVTNTLGVWFPVGGVQVVSAGFEAEEVGLSVVVGEGGTVQTSEVRSWVSRFWSGVRWGFPLAVFSWMVGWLKGVGRGNPEL